MNRPVRVGPLDVFVSRNEKRFECVGIQFVTEHSKKGVYSLMAGLRLIRTPVSNLLDFFSLPQTHSHHKIWYVHLPTVDLCSRHLFDLNICFGASWEALAFRALKAPDPMNPVPLLALLLTMLTQILPIHVYLMYYSSAQYGD